VRRLRNFEVEWVVDLLGKIGMNSDKRLVFGCVKPGNGIPKIRRALPIQSVISMAVCKDQSPGIIEGLYRRTKLESSMSSVYRDILCLSDPQVMQVCG
jgi:hypothetical protein